VIFDNLWRLEQQLGRTERVHARNRKELQKRKASKEEQVNAAEEANWARDTIRHLIEGEKSSRLIRRADRLRLPIPRYKVNENDESDEDKAWEVGYTGIAYLSRAAQFELRNQIRLEERTRRDDIVTWIKDIALPVVGILGALTGLIAAFRK
jgi:hypothetical protein